jgi:tetratricopeptide (TPR) repeat protein
LKNFQTYFVEMRNIINKTVLLFMGVLLVASCRPREQRDTGIPPLPEGETNTYKVHVQVLSEAIESYPNKADFYFKRAHLYFGNQQWPQALEDMNQAVDLDPNNGKYYLLRARLHQHLQHSEQAFADIQKAEKLQVQSSDFYTLLGELYALRKEYDKAREALNKSLEKAPYSGAAFYWKGAVAAETGDTTSALRFLGAALQYQPGNVETYDRWRGFFRQKEIPCCLKNMLP